MIVRGDDKPFYSNLSRQIVSGYDFRNWRRGLASKCYGESPYECEEDPDFRQPVHRATQKEKPRPEGTISTGKGTLFYFQYSSANHCRRW